MSITWVEKAPVRGGRLVKVGDTVSLAQTAPDFEMNKRFLGGQEGPFVVARVGRWDCGRHMIYLQMPGGSEPGIHTYDLE